MAYINGHEAFIAADVKATVVQAYVVNETGDSETLVMSQKAVTDKLQSAEDTATKLSQKISINDKRITNIEHGTVTSPFVTDDSVAYIKDVPSGALPYAEISKVGGMSYKDETTGLLRDTKVTAIKSVGANLIPFPYDVYSGTYSGVNITFNDDGSFTLDGIATSAAYLLLKEITLPAGTYYISDSGSNDWTARFYVSYSTNNHFKDSSFTLTEPTEVEFRLAVYEQFNGTATFYPMVNRGKYALPFTTYREYTFTIPEEVQNKEWYGIGVDKNYYNSADFTNNKGDIKARKIVFDGSADEVYAVGLVGSEFTIINITMLGGYDYSPAIINYDLPYQVGYHTNSAHFYVSHSLLTLVVPNSIVPDIGTFRTYVTNNPIVLVYALETPYTENINITDNFIDVEAGGTVTFVNDNGAAVPSEITYQVMEV